MRTPKFLSPSALSTWQSNSEEYYTKYLAENPPPRMAQTQPMSIGSSFDAYVKSYMFERLFGKGIAGSEFELNTIFESQVEEHNRDWAWKAGAYAFECYKKCGALADLLVELENAKDEPRFEFTVSDDIPTGKHECAHNIKEESFNCVKCGPSVKQTVPILGKPDVWYVDRYGNPIILDFKVNGFCSKYPVSPKRGYIRIRPGDKGSHKKCQESKVGGVTINIAEFFEAIDKAWAQQLATYAWLMGAPVGSFFIVALDQLCCSPSGEYPTIRVAEHRCQIGPDFQHKVLAGYAELWEIIHSDHIFRNRDKKESAARCDVLDMQHAAFTDGPSFIESL